MARPRSICFTLNNFTATELEFINKSVSDGNFKYFVCQQERGSAGTPHLQGYAQRANPTTFEAWKRFISIRIHIEASKGSAAQNRTYCTKDTDRIPGTLIIEKGEIPVPGERCDLAALVEASKDVTKSILDVIEADGAGFLKYHKGVHAIRSAFATGRSYKTQIFWFYGATGTGKTRAIFDICGDNAYWKQKSGWWCGYDPCTHHDVVIDEYRADFSKFSFLLSLFDRYPLQVEFKGGNCNFRARRIFISSPKSPSETWTTRTEEDLKQFLRRVENIVEFLPGGIRRYVKGSDAEGLLDTTLLPVVRTIDRAVEAEVEDQPVRQRARVETFNVADEPREFDPLWASPPPEFDILSQMSMFDDLDFDFDNEVN